MILREPALRLGVGMSIVLRSAVRSTVVDSNINVDVHWRRYSRRTRDLYGGCTLFNPCGRYYTLSFPILDTKKNSRLGEGVSGFASSLLITSVARVSSASNSILSFGFYEICLFEADALAQSRRA